MVGAPPQNGTLNKMSDFSDLITMTRTEEAYLNVPLSSLNRRGEVIEETTRKFMEVRTGQVSSRADITKSISGKKRGRNQTEYDFKINSQKYEVKSSQLCWNKHNNRWEAQWKDVKNDSHDVLLLVLYSPTGLSFYEHDGIRGVTTTGKIQESCGGRVVVRGKRNVVDIHNAEAVIHRKMEHMFLGRLSFDQISVPDVSSPFQGTPLFNKSSKTRGDIIENIARRFMESYSGRPSCHADITKSVSGNNRGKNQTEYDFKIDGQKYEVKSAQLCWDRHNSRWEAQWKDVKNDSHDVLVLVLYSPTGLSLYKHDGFFGVTTTGKLQASCGGRVVARGGRNILSAKSANIENAEEAIHLKMQHMLLGKIKF